MVFYAFSCLWVFISHSELGDSLFVGLPLLCTIGVQETIMCPCVFTRAHVCVCVCIEQILVIPYLGQHVSERAISSIFSFMVLMAARSWALWSLRVPTAQTFQHTILVLYLA